MGRLFDLHGPGAYALAVRILDDSAEAEEVVEEAFAAVLGTRQRGALPNAAAPGLLVHEVRRRALLRRWPVSADAAQDLYGGLDEAQVRAAVGTLSAEAVIVLRMAYFDRLTTDQISERLGFSTAAVRRALRSGLATLEGALEAPTPDQMPPGFSARPGPVSATAPSAVSAGARRQR